MIPIRENIPAYLEELRAWLREREEEPLEEMSAFFTARLGDYEAHMSPWAEGYRRMAELLPVDITNILDLGCGTGLEIDAILARFPTVKLTGVDLSAAMLAKLHEKHPEVDIICEDYFRYPLGEACWDCAVSFESLHHFPAEKKLGLYRRLRDAMRPGGVFLEADYLACCDEEERLLAETAARKRLRDGIPPETFVHFDTPLTAEHEIELLRRAGFRRAELVDCIAGAGFLLCEK